MFLEHFGNVPDNIVPDVLPASKNVIRTFLGKCSGQMFRATGFYVPGQCFFLTRACRRSPGRHAGVRKGTGPQHLLGHAALRCSTPPKVLRTFFGRPTRMPGRVVTARTKAQRGPQDGSRGPRGTPKTAPQELRKTHRRTRRGPCGPSRSEYER